MRADFIAELATRKLHRSDSRLPDQFTISAYMTCPAGTEGDIGPDRNDFGEFDSDDIATQRMGQLVRLLIANADARAVISLRAAEISVDYIESQ